MSEPATSAADVCGDCRQPFAAYESRIWLGSRQYHERCFKARDGISPAPALPGMETTAEERARWLKPESGELGYDFRLQALCRDFDRLLAERDRAFAAREIRETHLFNVADAALGSARDVMEACDLAQSAIAAAIRSAAPQWQPIESAPRDGETEVLAYIPLPTLSLPDNYRVMPLIWDDKTQVWRVSLHPFTKFAPTHWMPLPASPAPPEAISGKEG